MTKDKALIQMINHATGVLLGLEPVQGREGYSVVADWRIRLMADAIMQLRDVMGFNESTGGSE